MKGMGTGFIALVVLSMFCLFVAGPSYAYFFPDPVVVCPGVYDVLWGYVYSGFPAGTEVAGYDSNGDVVIRSATPGIGENGYYAAAVWSDVVEWRIYDPSNMYVWAAVVTAGSTWSSFDGGNEVYQLNLELFGDEPILIAPEPTTLLALGLLAASGMGFFRFKRRREE